MLSNEKLKLEKIKEAYAQYWPLVKKHIDQWGRLSYQDCTDIFGHNEFYATGGLSDIWVNDYEGYYCPKSIVDIDHNNGWIRIEQDHSNMPTEEGWYWTIDDNDQIEKIIWYNNGITEKIWKEYGKTHYMGVFELPKPIY